jgi:hypothetical protein
MDKDHGVVPNNLKNIWGLPDSWKSAACQPKGLCWYGREWMSWSREQRYIPAVWCCSRLLEGKFLLAWSCSREAHAKSSLRLLVVISIGWGHKPTSCCCSEANFVVLFLLSSDGAVSPRAFFSFLL